MEGVDSRVIVAHSRRHHLYYAAAAYLSAGLLEAFVTEVYVKKNSLAWKVLSSLGQFSNKVERFGGYSFPCIDKYAIVAQSNLCARVVFRVLGCETYSGNWEDAVVALAERNQSVVHIPCVHAKGAFERLDDKIPGLILEQYIADRAMGRSLLLEEVDKLGIQGMSVLDQIGLSEDRIDINRCEYEIADRIVVGSSFVRESLIDAGVSEKKIVTVSYGIDTEKWRYCERRRKKGEPLNVAFIGSGAIRKGLIYLLRACKGRRDVLVHVFGRCDDLPYEVYKGIENVRFYGHLPSDVLRQATNRCHVLVLPSLLEGSALVVGEAMAMGMPVIVTPNTGSWVRDGIDGFVVPIRSSDGISKALNQMMDEDRRIEMGRSARANAEKHTWLRYGHELLAGLAWEGSNNKKRQ